MKLILHVKTQVNYGSTLDPDWRDPPYDIPDEIYVFNNVIIGSHQEIEQALVNLLELQTPVHRRRVSLVGYSQELPDINGYWAVTQLPDHKFMASRPVGKDKIESYMMGLGGVEKDHVVLDIK